MKIKALTMICAAAIAVCGTVYAQSSVDRISVHFSTPVMVGETTLPAGDFSIQVIRGASDSVMLELRSAAGTRDGILVPVSRLSDSDVDTNGHVSVILSHRNNAYQLEQIVLADHTGFQVQE
jgi:2-methylaconitate cis-trans-isomerase PrpF